MKTRPWRRRACPLPSILAVAFCVFQLGGETSLAAGATPVGIGLGDYVGLKITLLAIDDNSLPLKEDLCFYLSKPKVRAEPVLTPSRDNPHATDTVATHCYGTVLHENGKFRLWYYGVGLKSKPNDTDIETTKLREGPVCYAESEDGIHWAKPKLGQVKFNGGSDNNAIALPSSSTEGAFVIKDESDPNPARRYKMIYESTAASPPKAEAAASPDGIHWTGAGTAAVGLEPSSFYKYNGLYVINAQIARHFGEGGHRTGRQGYAWISTDFSHWLPEAGESFVLPEPSNPNDRGGDRPYVQVHLGVGAFAYGNVLVGIYCQWHALPGPGDWFGRGTTFGDFGLLVSNDGQHFRETVKGHVFLDRHDSKAVVDPGIRAEEILTQSGNGILNVGDETRIYHGRWVNAEKLGNYYAEIALATLPRDRWGALGLCPGASLGSVWTAPVSVGKNGCRVSFNAQGCRGMRVEAADESFNLIPEYSGENSGKITTGDGLDCPVAWPNSTFDSLAGRKVRLLIRLQRLQSPEPRLFAVYLASE